MSPLLGALGDSSEYAYRGTLDDLPDNFSFTSITGAEPGIAYTTGPVLITGLNNKVKVTVSAGASLAINSGIFTSGPSFIRSGDILSIYTPTTQGADTDFSKTYNIEVTVGKTTKNWSVKTRDKDSSPVNFTFASALNQELGITSTSNTITLSGLEPTVSSMAAITSGIGSFRKNGGSPGTATTVGNGDTLAIVLRAPTDYSKTNTTAITVGDYTTSYSVSTRPADTTVNQFSFNNFTNVAISSSFDSNSITLSGADNNTALAPVPLTATVTGGFLKVERGPLVVRDFSADPATVFNGDILTLKINSSINYSTTLTARLTVTGVNNPIGVTSTFSVTTRPNISDTIVNNFQIVDKDNQRRGISTISDPITISGITTGADDFASIFLTNNADGGQFRITRDGVVVRDFGTDNSGVRNGDVVDLRITTSPASEGTVLTNVSIAGTDNSDINNILNQTRTDTWVVKSAKRNCPLTLPTFEAARNVDPSTLQSVTFTPTSYDDDCNVIVSTSNPNSYIKVGVTTGNNLSILPGVACTVFMTAGTFSENRTTTITLRANNNVPTPVSTTATWSVITRASSDPTVNLSANTTSIACGGQALLSWTSSNTVSVSFNGFSGVGTNSSAPFPVNPRVNTTYSITATGPDGTTRTSPVTIFVSTPAEVFIEALTDTFIPFNGSVKLRWESQNASSVISNFGASAPSGERTINNIKQTTTYSVTAVSNSGCANSQPDSIEIQVEPCEEDTIVDTIDTGVDINYTLANAGSGFKYHFTSVTGFGVNNPARDTSPSSTPGFFRDVGSGNFAAGTCGADRGNCRYLETNFVREWIVPAGVTRLFITASGAGGGGAGGGIFFAGGDGGDAGLAETEWFVNPGDRILYSFGGGGFGAAGCNASNISRGGVTGGPGWSTYVWYNSTSFLVLFAGGGGGGGRDENGPLPASIGQGTSPTNGLTDGGGSAGGSGGGATGRSPCVNGPSGGNGQAGFIEIDYEISQAAAASESWSTLINSIAQQFRSSFNRPPTDTEMDNYINQYINSSVDINTITSRIASSGLSRSNGGAVSVCGSTL